MGKVFDGIDERLAGWIAAQHMFFVATAPCEGGHVNLPQMAAFLEDRLA